MLLDLLAAVERSASILGFDCRRQSIEVRRASGSCRAKCRSIRIQTGAGYLKFLSALGAQPAAPSRLEFLFGVLT